jgi:hypothetical protein
MELADEFKQMARQLEADARTRTRARSRRRTRREDAATYRQPAVR